MKQISTVQFDGGVPTNQEALRLIGREPAKTKLGGLGYQNAILETSSKEYAELKSFLMAKEVEVSEFRREEYEYSEIADTDLFWAFFGNYWSNPEPIDGFERDVYDERTACPICENGATQVGNYRVRGKTPPKSASWVVLGIDFADLVSEKLIAEFSKAQISGWEQRPIIDYRSGEQIAGWWQLKCSNVLPPMSKNTVFPIVREFAPGTLPPEGCSCGRVGRNVPEVFVYDREVQKIASDCNYTHEWLGGGIRTFRQIVFSGRVVKIAMQLKVRPMILRRVTFA